MALYTIRLNSLFNIYSTHATTIIAAITTAVAIFIAGILRSIASDIPNISRPLITSTVSTIDGSRNARQNTTSSMNCLKYSMPISNPAVSVARYNCPELCHCFCDSDDITYEGLHKKLVWRRTKTLGRGNECCDFCLMTVK